MVQRELADAARVGVLGDVALAAGIDQDPAHQLLRLDEDGDLGGVHVGQVGAERLGHPDALAVVLLDRRGGLSEDPRCVLGDHRVVVGEAAGGKHHAAAGTDRDLLAVLAGGDPDDPAVGLDDQRLHPHVVERTGRRDWVAVSTSGFISM